MELLFQEEHKPSATNILSNNMRHSWGINETKSNDTAKYTSKVKQTNLQSIKL